MKLQSLTTAQTLSRFPLLLASELFSKLHTRFGKEFALDEQAKYAFCATFSNPKYKNRWGTSAQCDKALVIFKNEFDKYKVIAIIQSQEIPVEPLSRRGFSLHESEGNEIDKYSATPPPSSKYLKHIQQSKECSSNTKLPTSATVERKCSVLPQY